jgi:hypothetical protein
MYRESPPSQSSDDRFSRKADLRVFPMLCFVFGLSLLDRTNISSAYIAGLSVDLKLGIENRYNIALLVFFIGKWRALGRNKACTD